MRNLIVAEWQKLNGNRWLAGFLIWIYPVGACATIVVMSLIAIYSEQFRGFINADPGTWTENVIGALGLPTNAFGRTLLVTFAVVAFAGEYQWGTWKNTIPRSSRVKLILSKFVAMLLMVSVSCLIFAIIWGVGRGIVVNIAGAEYGPPLTNDVLRDFLGDFAGRYVLVMISVFIAASQAAFIALLARSVLAGVIFGLGIAIAEPISFLGLTVASSIMEQPWILRLGRILPYYHFDNAINWIVNEAPSTLILFAADLGADYVFEDSLRTSIMVLILWALILPSLITLLFRRQDITS